MQSAIPRALFTRASSLSSISSFARVGAFDARQLNSFPAKPIARLVAALVPVAFAAAVPGIRQGRRQFVRDDNTAGILANAKQVEMTTRSEWLIDA